MSNASRAVAPSPSVNWNERCAFLVTSGDGGLIFDLDHRRFRVLDPVASKMWTLLSEGKPESEVVNVITELCKVDAHLVAADLKKLLASAAELDLVPSRLLITPQPEAPPATNGKAQQSYPWYGQDATAYRPKTQVWRVLKARLGLLWFDRILTKHGLKGLCRRVSEWPLKTTGHQSDPEIIGRICAAVERACVWYRKPAVCLEISAVETCMLRDEGVDARMVIASKIMPLEPHAYVEVNGHPVNDFPKVRTLYLRFVSF